MGVPHAMTECPCVMQNAGFMDRADPYVLLALGNETLKTSFKENAGGKNVVFNETLTFNKPLLQGKLVLKGT